MKGITQYRQNSVGKEDRKSNHGLYSISTLIDIYDDEQNLQQLYRLVAEVKDCMFQGGNQEKGEKCFYSLHSKSLTIIDIFTHLLRETREQNLRKTEQYKENEQILQREIQQLKNWHIEESQKSQYIRLDLIRNNENLSNNIEILEDMLEKIKIQYDIVRNQLEELSKIYAQQVKDKQTLASQLHEAITYIEEHLDEQKIIEEEQSLQEDENRKSICKINKKMLRSLKRSPANSHENDKFQHESERSDNSPSNLLYLGSPIESERQKQVQKVHEQYKEYIQKRNNSSNRSFKRSYNPMLSPHSNLVDQQHYYNPTLIVNSSQQNSIDVRERDRTSFQSVEKPAILTEILNLNSSYQNTANRLSSYQKYENINPFTNQRVSIDIAKGQIKTIQHFQEEEDQQNNQNGDKMQKREKNQINNKKNNNQNGESIKLIRIHDQNNANIANTNQKDVLKVRKRKGSTVIGQFTTGETEEQKIIVQKKSAFTDPYLAFFTLTVQCAKINCNRLEEAASVDLSSLWNHITTTKLPIHQWHAFVASSLDKILSQKANMFSKQNYQQLQQAEEANKNKKKTKLHRKSLKNKHQEIKRDKWII